MSKRIKQNENIGSTEDLNSKTFGRLCDSPSFCKGSFLIKLPNVSEGISKKWLRVDLQKRFFRMRGATGKKNKTEKKEPNHFYFGGELQKYNGPRTSSEEIKSRILSSWLEGKEGLSGFMGVVLHFPSWLVVWKGNEIRMVEVAALAGDTTAHFLINKKGHEELKGTMRNCKELRDLHEWVSQWSNLVWINTK